MASLPSTSTPLSKSLPPPPQSSSMSMGLPVTPGAPSPDMLRHKEGLPTIREKPIETSNRWFFNKEEIEKTPSRKCGYDSDKELNYRQQAANFIQDMGQRLQVNQLCINTAIVYMHRFYMYHSFTQFHRNAMSMASIFLAAKVEEQPRKLEHVIKVAHWFMYRDGTPFDPKSEQYAEQSVDLVMNENILLQTLGFDVAIDHPHTHVVKCCQLVRASKELAQTSYFIATNSLHLTTMCLQYKPTVVACVCIHLACKWSNWEIPRSKEGRDWFWYVDDTVTMEILEKMTSEFLEVFNKSPSRLKKKIMSLSQQSMNSSSPVSLSSYPSTLSSHSHTIRSPIKKIPGQKSGNPASGAIPNKAIKHHSGAPHGQLGVKPGSHNHHGSNQLGTGNAKHVSGSALTKGHNQMGSTSHTNSSNPMNVPRGVPMSHGASSHIGSSLSTPNNHKSAHPSHPDLRKGTHEQSTKSNAVDSLPKVVVTDHGGDRHSMDPSAKYGDNMKMSNHHRYPDNTSKVKKNLEETFDRYVPVDSIKRESSDLLRKNHEEPQKVPPHDIHPPPPPLVQKPMPPSSTSHSGQPYPHKERSTLKDQRNHSYGGHNHRSYNPYSRPSSSSHSSSSTTTSNSHSSKTPSMPPLQAARLPNPPTTSYSGNNNNNNSSGNMMMSSSVGNLPNCKQLNPSKLAHMDTPSPPRPPPPLYPANIKKEKDPFPLPSSLLMEPSFDFKDSNHSDLMNNGDSGAAQNFDAMFGGKKLDGSDGMPVLGFGGSSSCTNNKRVLPLHMEKFPSAGYSADKDNGLNDIVKMEFDTPKLGTVFDFGDERDMLPVMRKGDIKQETDSQTSSSSKHAKKQKKEKHKHKDKEKSKDEKKHKKEKHEKEKKHKKDKHKEKDKEKDSKILKQKIIVKEVQPPPMTSDTSEFKIKIKLGKDDKRGRSRSEITGQKR